MKLLDGSSYELVQLFEGEEYLYSWEGPAGDVVTEPRELFRPDRHSGRSGRLRTGLSVGFVPVTVFSGLVEAGTCELEVRPRKLTYEDEYKWMLRDIAEQMAELLMERFAASDLQFSVDVERNASTLYQRFEFLRALIGSEDFQGAMQEVLRRPHTGWVTTPTPVEISRGVRPSSNISKQLARRGIDARNLGLLGHFDGARSIFEDKTEATHDTTPNRFVRHAFRHWLFLLGDLQVALEKQTRTAPIARGLAEVRELASTIEQFISDDLFLALGDLDRFPSEDQVLQKRQGYREVFRAFLEFELGALLTWSDSSFAAGTRNVAATYEYWAFLQLAKCVARVAGVDFAMADLLTLDQFGLSVQIRKGVEQVFCGIAVRNGRRMSIELWFNKTYGVPQGSWSRSMRPDYSLLIQPESRDKPFEIVLVHFDAKYRVQFIRNLLLSSEGLEEGEVSDEEALTRGEATSGDLLKMHAYRDAIRRTSGAYVLYPGGDAELGRKPLSEYQELLPGLGAFVLRPAEGGDVLGSVELQGFIERVVDHSATRLTQHQRSRYWEDAVYAPTDSTRDVYAGLPPGSATVLLGFVKSKEHWEWIKKTASYNVRVSGREGGVGADSVLFNAQLILLYCPSINKVRLARLVAGPEQLSALELKATGYPQPQGPLYWCVQLLWVNRPEWTEKLSCKLVEVAVSSQGGPLGGPVLMTWAALLSTAS
ncbi:DUF2357 domain-containing protein [Ramlibacter tataouinensis]|uniref:DUF2357 domain-containing protein n=1 Tax=Ramlibacter tataouinensis TaxID=94132 RepID=UPI0013053CD9|nr:DUF2357 domain-containing protein [Ramlibacter tataouinensis]